MIPELRSYQEQSIEALRNLFKVGHKRIVLCAATGSGKSIVMLSMIQSAMSMGKHALFVCERRNLVEQFSRHLSRHGIKHGVIMDGSDMRDLSQPLQVCTAQSLERMGSWPKFDVVFLDELHVLMRKSVIAMIEAYPEMRIVGSTATPFNPKIGKYFTGIANVITMNALTNDGYLLPFRVFASKEIEVKGVKVDSKGEWNEAEISRRGIKIVGDVVEEYIRIATSIYGEYRKTICFSAGIAHGKALAAEFNEAGVYAIQLTCNDNKEYRNEVLNDFSRADTDVRILISADLLTRGYDQTDVEHVILAKPYRKSFSSFVQAIGRGCRPHEGQNYCVLQDHGGNWLRFAKDWEELFYSGVKELDNDKDIKVRKEPTEEEKKAAKCPDCGALWPAKSEVCSHCGFVREKKNVVEALPGTLTEIGSKNNAKVKKTEWTIEYKTSFYAQLLGYAKSHNYAPGWAYFKYKEKFGVAPGMAKPLPEQPGREVLNYAAYLNIRYAKGKEKSRK